jgi:hypothetical protein
MFSAEQLMTYPLLIPAIPPACLTDSPVKEEMENEYSTFATQYDELQVQINNDSLREKLESEKLKTQRLLEELR